MRGAFYFLAGLALVLGVGLISLAGVADTQGRRACLYSPDGVRLKTVYFAGERAYAGCYIEINGYWVRTCGPVSQTPNWEDL